jgi:hypothetical protein
MAEADTGVVILPADRTRVYRVFYFYCYRGSDSNGMEIVAQPWFSLAEGVAAVRQVGHQAGGQARLCELAAARSFMGLRITADYGDQL